MLSLFEPLFRQFAAVEHPIRFFLLRFIILLGIVHIINDGIRFFFSSEFMEAPRLYLFSLLLTALVFLSDFFKQKKHQQDAAQAITD